MNEQGTVQILGLRQVDPENKPKDVRERFFEKNWRAESVADLLGNLDKHLEMIPEDMRYNMFYTVCQCIEARGRQLSYQDIIPIDIDGVDKEVEVQEYIDVACKCLRVSPKQIGIVWSGNGLQLLIKTTKVVTDVEQFDALRDHYKALCGKLATAFYNAGLMSDVDPSVWSPARLMRLPGTTNHKPWKGRPDAPAYLINGTLEAIDFDLKEESQLPEVLENEQVSPQQLKSYPIPDTEGVQEGCKFLQYCKENQNEVSEPQWYSALSIVSRLEDGHALAHAYSEEHEMYDEAITEKKIIQAMKNSGPRTCNNIATMYDGCAKCEHFQKIISPITIKGDTYIKTIGTGFYHMIQAQDGSMKPGKPDYEGLIQHFKKQHIFKADVKTGSIFTWEGSHWEEKEDRMIEAFAYKHMAPKPATMITAEFKSRMELTNQIPSNWFVDRSDRKMNFSNGTLNLLDMSFSKHDPNNGFLNTLPYEYDGEAECPRFDQFMGEVTQDDEDMSKMLMEFAGYAFSGMDCSYAKALLLTGEGSNGKSTFLDTLLACAGEGSYSSVSLGELNNEQHRARMYGKLFNVSEEIPKKALSESSTFKTLVTGGEISFKVVYKPTFTSRNKTKLLNACNRLPMSEDTSHGLYRRMLIVPFDACFEGKEQDKKLLGKLRAERSGIFNRIIEGYHRLENQGSFTAVRAVEKAGKEYILDNDRVYRWALDALVEEENKQASVALLYQNYKDTCLEEGTPAIKIEDIRVFTRNLNSKYRNIVKGKATMGKKQVAVFNGIRFKSDDELTGQGGF